MANLQDLIYSEDRKDRRKAIQMLARSSDPRAVEYLGRIASTDSDPDLRELAEHFLRERGASVTDDLSEKSKSGWMCANCGAENAMSAAECAYCGTTRSIAAPKAKPKRGALPDIPEKALDLPGGVFLFNLQNRKYVDGLASKPRFGSGEGCGILFLIPFVLAGVFVAVFALYQWSEYLQLTTSGIRTNAIVTGKEIDADEESTSYLIYFYYIARDDRRYEQSESVSSDEYNRLAVQDSVPVLYLPNTPATARLALDNGRLGLPDMELFLAGFAVCWNGFIGLFVVAAVNGAQKAGKLARMGQRLDGEIDKIDHHLDSDDDLSLTVHYHFVNPDGLGVRGKLSNIRNDLKNTRLPAPGTPVIVWYADDKTHTIL
jgi:ribosomal protein L40E